jgi:hypothetical protein
MKHLPSYGARFFERELDFLSLSLRRRTLKRPKPLVRRGSGLRDFFFEEDFFFKGFLTPEDSTDRCRLSTTRGG